MAVTYQWRGAFTSAEVNALHAESAQAADGLTAMARKMLHYKKSTRQQSRQE